MHFLIVDDEDVSRAKLNAILSEVGMCEEASSGEEAVNMFKEAWEENMPFTTITLDIEMDGMSGIETLDKIKEIEKEMELPVQREAKIFMVTSSADREKVVASISKGCIDYIVKPFDGAKIIDKINSVSPFGRLTLKPKKK